MPDGNPNGAGVVECAMPELQSREIGKLAEALSKAQGELKTLKAGKKAEVVMKDNKGKYSYKYADLADVLESSREALSKNGLAVVQTYEVGVPLILNTTMMHTSGEWLRSSLPIMIPPGSRPQEIGSLMTYMRRYALSALVGLAAEDEDDDGKGAQDAADKKQPPAKPQAQANPDLVTDAQCQLLYSTCEQHGVTSTNAKAHLKEKYGVTAAAQIKKKDFNAILAWVKEQKKATPPPTDGGANA